MSIIKNKISKKSFISFVLVIVFAVLTTSLVVKITSLMVEAGSLTPPAAPASTMKNLQEVYDSIASTTFDSSGISASYNGSALQVAKCAITKMQGGTCE